MESVGGHLRVRCKLLSSLLFSLFASCGSAQQLQTLPATATLRDDGSASWNFGFTISGGFAPNYQINSLLNYQEELQFYTAGVEVGRSVTKLRGRGLDRGRGEVRVELNPLWLDFEPQQTDKISNLRPNTTATFAGYLGHGIEGTPLLYRWNLYATAFHQWCPGCKGEQGCFGLRSASPQGYTYAAGGNTSRINFTPQVGAGVSIPAGQDKRLELGVRTRWVGSAGLGEYNPGVTTLQFTAGLSWLRHKHR